MSANPIHATPFEGAGRTYKIALDGIPGDTILIEDWWDRVSGQSWAYSRGNPAAINYAIRTAMTDVPDDDEVVYGKALGMGHLVHVSELGDPQ